MDRRNSEPLRLQIPQPARRPGEAPDFSGLVLPGPGEASDPSG